MAILKALPGGGEETEYPEPILEMALIRKIDAAVKAAYQRGDLLNKRRALNGGLGAKCAAVAPFGFEHCMAGLCIRKTTGRPFVSRTFSGHCGREWCARLSIRVAR
tara:strand:- start:64170 stop:64487 length:318 start_codon:yes stop_codon:yes gene_type:complete